MDLKTINNRYNVLRILGQGGLGTVYLAEDLLLGGEQIALKKINKIKINRKNVMHFKREFDLMSRLKHPHLVRVYDFGIHDADGAYFITMEYAGERTLQDRLAVERRISAEAVLQIMVKLLRALAFIHSRNILHLDVKPANIMGTASNIRLMDFGIAALGAPKNQSFRATLHYMAPELLKGVVNRQTDIFSTGVTFFRLLTGERFYSRERFPTIFDIAGSETAFEENHDYVLSRLPDDGYRHIIGKMTAFDARKRYDTAHQVLHDINNLMGTDFDLETEATRRAYVLGAGFVGRKKELYDVIKNRGKNVVTCVHGVAGSGKSRLFQEYKKFCQLQEIPFFEGSCYENVSRSYLPLLEIISDALFAASEEELNTFGPQLKKLLPFHRQLESYTPVVDINPRKEHEILVDNVVSFLFSTADNHDETVVYFFNDLQWADDLTLETLLKFLRIQKRLKETKPCAVYFSVQNEERINISPFLSELKDRFSVSEITLTSFDVNDGLEFMKAIFGEYNVGQNFVSLVPKIIERVNGIPLFLQEYVRQLVVDEHLVFETRQWELVSDKKHISVPFSRAAIIRKRLEALELDTNEIQALKILALLGRGVSIQDFDALVRPVIPLKTRQLLMKLEKLELLQTDVLDESLQYFFVNSLIQKQIIESIENVSKLHTTIAGGLERIHKSRIEDYYEELAYHYTAANDRDKSLEYLVKSGDKSSEEFALDKATAYYDQALELMDPAPSIELLDLWFRKAEQVRRTSRWKDIKPIYDHCLDMAEKLENKLYIANAKLSLGELRRLEGYMEEALALQSDALTIYRELGEEKRESFALLNVGNIYLTTGAYERALSFYGKAQKICQLLNDTGTLLRVINNIGSIHWMKGEYDEAEKYYRMKLKVAHERNDKLQVGNAYNNLGSVYGVQGKFDLALECFQTRLQIALETGDKSRVITARLNIGEVYRIMGKFDAAEKNLRKSMDLADYIGDRANYNYALQKLGHVYKNLGQDENAVECYFEAIKRERQLETVYYLAEYLCDCAEMVCRQGDIEQADTLCSEAYLNATAIKRKDILARIQRLRLQIAWGSVENDEQRSAVIQKLRKMISASEEREHLAELYLMLFSLTRSEEEGETAAHLFGQLAEEIPSYENRQKLLFLDSQLEE